MKNLKKRSTTLFTNRFSITFLRYYSLQLSALMLTASVFASKSFHVHLLLDIGFEIVSILGHDREVFDETLALIGIYNSKRWSND